MGYTHYWYRTEGRGDRLAFQQLGTDARAIIREAEAQGIKVANGLGESMPDFTETYFAINGRGDESHETFYWPCDVTREIWETHPSKVFSFTKTAHKPYDAVVCAILIRAKVIYGDALDVSSDGTWAEWIPGRRLYLVTFDDLAPRPFGRDYVDLIGGL